MKIKIIILLVPLVIGFIALGIFANDSPKEIIPNENIIVNENFEELQTKIKSNDEIMEEINQKYNEIEQKNNLNEYELTSREWQQSGPFSIDRKEYALGEKIFMMVQGLKINESGQISVLRPLNQTHYSVWNTYSFDGNISESFNIYFEPKLLKTKQICDKEDLLGNWVMVFQNTNYDNLRFKIIDKIVTGDEYNYNIPVC